MKKRVIRKFIVKQTDPISREEYNQLQKQIDKHTNAIRKLHELSLGLKDQNLKDLVDKNIASEEKEIIELNRIQLRGNGHNFYIKQAPLTLIPSNYEWVE
jgi:hypothetical protein